MVRRTIGTISRVIAGPGQPRSCPLIMRQDKAKKRPDRNPRRSRDRASEWQPQSRWRNGARPRKADTTPRKSTRRNWILRSSFGGRLPVCAVCLAGSVRTHFALPAPHVISLSGYCGRGGRSRGTRDTRFGVCGRQHRFNEMAHTAPKLRAPFLRSTTGDSDVA
jgi:hypothetical protein